MDAEELQAACAYAEKNSVDDKGKRKCCNCDAEMTPNHQCEIWDSDRNWEDIESEEDSYPTLDLNSEDWADKFTNSVRRFHGSNP